MKRMLQLILVALVLVLFAGVAGAAPAAQAGEEGVPYTVRPGDGLIRLARAFYGEDDAYLFIVAATNARAATDSSYDEITDPNIILVGSKLWIPGLSELPDLGGTPAADEAAADETVTVEEDTTMPETTELTGTSWQMTSLNNQTPVANTTVTLDFAAGGEASGTSGCNRYGTTYEVDGIKISFGQTFGTLMACPEPVMAQEEAYLAALGAAAFFEATPLRLRLFDEDSTLLVEFAPVSTSLAGTAWEATAYNNGKEAVVGVIEGTTLTAVFDDEGGISGSAGCNNFFGSYTAADGTIEIGPLGSTRKLCPGEGVMEQEAAYLAALETAATYRISGASLEMRTADDALVGMFTLAQ